MKIKECRWCKDEFTVRSRCHYFCSSICRNEWYQWKYSRLNKARAIIFKRDGYRCFYCGQSLEEDPDLLLLLDHIIPISKGGGSSADNLVTSCSLCNFMKGNLLLEDAHYDEISKRNKELGYDISVIQKMLVETAVSDQRKRDTLEYEKQRER